MSNILATTKMVQNILDGTTPPQKVEGQYDLLEEGGYNLTVGVTGAAPAEGSVISQINGNDLADSAFRAYVNTDGAVLFSFNDDFSPSALYGGNWEKITDRFPIGAGGIYALKSTGGEANVTLTVEQIPPHSHQMNYYNDESTPPSGGDWIPAARRSTGYNVEGGDTENTGGGQAHNNLPPYIAVNIWRRVH